MRARPLRARARTEGKQPPSTNTTKSAWAPRTFTRSAGVTNSDLFIDQIKRSAFDVALDAAEVLAD
jgi:hypothetical protein